MEQRGRETIGRFIALLFRMSNVYLGQELASMKIGAGQYSIMAELFDEEGLSQDELTKRAYVDKANTARSLQKLEKIGYVRRAVDEKNRRIKRAYLQPSASEIEEDFWNIVVGWSQIISKDISQERQDQMIKDLKKMADNAAAYLKRY